MPESIHRACREAWSDERLRLQLVTAPVLLWLLLRELSRFLVWVERRPGARLSDTILALVAPRDATS